MIRYEYADNGRTTSRSPEMLEFAKGVGAGMGQQTEFAARDYSAIAVCIRFIRGKFNLFLRFLGPLLFKRLRRSVAEASDVEATATLADQLISTTV